MYEIKYHKRALKDVEKIKQSKLNNRVKKLIEILKYNPYQNPPPYEQLLGDLHGLYSRKINFQHRLVYQILESENIIRILSMWSHYENI